MHPSGIAYKSITGNPRLLLISFGKTAVDDQETSSAFDGRFPVYLLHRHMSVYDMGILIMQAKLIQYTFYRLFLLKKPVIAVFLLLMGLLLRHEIPLKSGHLLLAEHRRARPRPDIPHHILTYGPLPIVLGIISPSGIIL